MYKRFFLHIYYDRKCGWYSKHDDARNCLLNFDFMGIVNNNFFFYECNRGVWPKIFFLLKTQIIRETQTTSWPSGFISWRHPVSMAEALCEIPCFVINNNCYKCYCWGFFGRIYRVSNKKYICSKLQKLKILKLLPNSPLVIAKLILFPLITFGLRHSVEIRRWISGTESAHLAAIDSNLIFIQGWWWCLTRIGDSKGLFNYSEFMIISCSWSWMIISTSIILFVIAEWSRQMIWLGLLLKTKNIIS